MSYSKGDTMSHNIIDIYDLSKIYKIYDNHMDRLKEAINPFNKKYHRQFYALNNISFDIKNGETIGIIGKNGSGKSTLLKIITGVLTPTSGIVKVNGKVSALLELGAGFNPEYSGLENIYLNGTMMGYEKQEIDERLNKILTFADIGEFIHQPVKMYSSGMFMRLAFAVAINVDPDILIVDEALAVGDIRFQLKCMDKFAEFRNQGKTILFVTHDINSVKRFCTRTIWLNEGEIKFIGDTDTGTDLYLDYLKVESSKENSTIDCNLSINSNEGIHENTSDTCGEELTVSSVDIAEIKSVRMLNSKNKESYEFQHNERVCVEIEYHVADINVKNPVIGVAIRTIDNQYICGLNTLLDNQKVKWDIGANTFLLEYKNLNLIGGSYYIDVAIFDQNAMVSIDYKSKVKTFFIHSAYLGEGIMILDHKWSAKGD